MKNGLTPLPNHRVVKIVPDKWYRPGESQGGGHRPPRLHWRRSHLRHFDHQTGSAVWKHDEVWQGKTGWFVTVIPRMIIGRAELGAVSHEYQVVH